MKTLFTVLVEETHIDAFVRVFDRAELAIEYACAILPEVFRHPERAERNHDFECVLYIRVGEDGGVTITETELNDVSVQV
jgi:hypothetical protein